MAHQNDSGSASGDGSSERHGHGARLLVLGITGSVGATSIPNFVTLVRQSFADEVAIIMTRAARRFLHPYVARIYSGREPVVDLFQPTQAVAVPHIELAARADLFVVMPATANIISKIAHGIADDPVSTTALAVRCPIALVPSMNQVMWMNQFVQENVLKLKNAGYHVMQPAMGIEVSSMEPSYGAMPSSETVIKFLHSVMAISCIRTR